MYSLAILLIYCGCNKCLYLSMQAIVGKGELMWSKDHVDALRKICPMLTGASFGEAASAEIEGYGSSKITVESAVKYLQLANKLFVQAELYHFCAGKIGAFFWLLDVESLLTSM